MAVVTIFTDGACLGNPGRGGYAAVLKYGDETHQIGGGFNTTTNNRMELMAVIEALASLKRSCEVSLSSDSAYVVRAINDGWVNKWKRAGWKRGANRGAPLKNVDLWQKLLDQIARHKVTFNWVKAHSGVEENEWCDVLAKDWANRDDLPDDTCYLNSERE